MVDPCDWKMYNENIILSLMWVICEKDNPTVISLNNGQIITNMHIICVPVSCMQAC